MQTTFQKIKESVANPEIRLRLSLDAEVRFAMHLQWAFILAQWVAIFTNTPLLLLIGTVGFWYGFVKYVKNILRVHDEWKAEKEKEESNSNEGEAEESKED